jgi:hypothetical protein
MKKTILAAAVVALATVAHADSLESLRNSSDKSGISDIVNGIAGSSHTTLIEVSEKGQSAADSLSTAAVDSADKASDVTMYILENPSDASDKASKWVIDTTGQVYEFSKAQTSAFLKNPSDYTSKLIEKSGKAIEVTFDASGRVMKASGEYLTDKSGKHLQLVLDGSGKAVVMSGDALVVVKNASVAGYESVKTEVSASAKAVSESALVVFVNEHSVQPVITSAKNAAAIAKASAIASANNVSELSRNIRDGQE